MLLCNGESELIARVAAAESHAVLSDARISGGVRNRRDVLATAADQLFGSRIPLAHPESDLPSLVWLGHHLPEIYSTAPYAT